MSRSDIAPLPLFSSASKFRNPTRNLFTTDLKTDALNAAPSEGAEEEKEMGERYESLRDRMRRASLSLRIAGLDAAHHARLLPVAKTWPFRIPPSLSDFPPLLLMGRNVRPASEA